MSAEAPSLSPRSRRRSDGAPGWLRFRAIDREAVDARGEGGDTAVRPRSWLVRRPAIISSWGVTTAKSLPVAQRMEPSIGQQSGSARRPRAIHAPWGGGWRPSVRPFRWLRSPMPLKSQRQRRTVQCSAVVVAAAGADRGIVASAHAALGKEDV
eukprot:scaffold2809_cov373-Prasinococcus_capsulatus_cf.AAC.11